MPTFNNKNLCDFCFEEIPHYSSACTSCEGEPNTAKYPTALPEGSVLAGKYLVGKVLGKGGFGVTYLAYDLKENKKVAIKEYLPDAFSHRDTGKTMVSVYTGEKDAQFRIGAQKFLEEARLVSCLGKNPNIINVYGLFYENNTAYFVMDYLSGTDMKGYLKKHKTISEGEVMYIAQRTLDALLTVHNANTIHRDISPDNIYLCDDGCVKLIDFGASRHVIANETNSLSVILKHGFAPLEQYQTKGKQGPWTDIYALGVTFYFALKGTMPDDAMSRIDNAALDMSGISPALARIINKMMAPMAADRYTDVLELKRDFDELEITPTPLILKPKVRVHYCSLCGRKMEEEGRVCAICLARSAPPTVIDPTPDYDDDYDYDQSPETELDADYETDFESDAALAYGTEYDSTGSQTNYEDDYYAAPSYEEESVDYTQFAPPAPEYTGTETKNSTKKKLVILLSLLAGLVTILVVFILLLYFGVIGHSHDYAMSTIITPATCTTEGVRRMTCECGKTKEVAIPITDHKYENPIVKNATCTAEGSKTYHCSCGATRIESIPRTAHTYSNPKVTTKATCTAEGVKTYYCTCGKTKTETIAKTDHVFEDYKVTTEATCMAEGVKTYYCTCGKTKTEKIPKTDHVYSDSKITKEPTTTSTGILTYYCKCGKTRTETIAKVTGLSWSVKNGVLTISGNGPMTDTPWESYKNQVTTLVVGNGITSICDYAFYSFTKLKTVTLPTTLKTIGASAFSNCKSIDIIQIPQGVTSIGASAFYNCSGMKSLYISNSASYIGGNAFYGCSALKNVIIDKKKGTINESIFPYGVEIEYTK